MKSYKIFCLLFALLLTCSLTAFSLDLPIKTIGNTDFYCYKVQAKETIFGISKKLNISQDDLKKYNPSVANGLKKDYILLIPVSLIQEKDEQNDVIVSTNCFTHTVQKGETLYGISKTYNVSQDTIIALNPEVVKGVKTGQKLQIPQPQKITADTTAQDLIYHTIVKGETLYSLSKYYNTTIENILSLNPALSPTNFKINDVIKIAPNTVKPEMTATTVTTMDTYVARKGDNYKKIAKNTGIDIDDLKAANPNVEKVKEGTVVQIPVVKEDSVLMLVNEGTEEELNHNDSNRIKEIYDSVHYNNSDKVVNVALLLPYMLNDTLPSKQAMLYTEFYKGFLLAVKEINNVCENNINVFTYDTQKNEQALTEILGKPEMKTMDLIFASDEISQLNQISQFCQENKVYLVNSFSMKSEDYNTNPYFFQLNIPQSFMQSKVFDWFDNEFEGYDVVFVHKKGTAKKEMADDLKAHLTEKGCVIHDVEYQALLSYDMLAEKLEPTKKYVFIPTTGTKTAMSKLLPAMKRLNKERIDLETAVWGYPEWVTYTDDWSDDYHSTNTYFYSRFYVNPENVNVTEMESEYKQWYGEEMISAAPQFGLLGYDAGKYFLKSICENGKELNSMNMEYEGLQNAFNFERVSNWSGYVNKSLYFIHFTPDNKIETVIR